MGVARVAAPRWWGLCHGEAAAYVWRGAVWGMVRTGMELSVLANSAM